MDSYLIKLSTFCMHANMIGKFWVSNSQEEMPAVLRATVYGSVIFTHEYYYKTLFQCMFYYTLLSVSSFAYFYVGVMICKSSKLKDLR